MELASVNMRNFSNGVASARGILNKLEESIQKSNAYQVQLLQCKSYHTHSHDIDDFWETDASEKNYKDIKIANKKSPSKCNEFTESWSAMIIICLQHKYEELSKRYKALLHEYNERCGKLSVCNDTLLKMRYRVRRTYSKLMKAHETLLIVGEKYLALRRRMNERKSYYEAKIIKLQFQLNELVETAEQARIDFDLRLKECLAGERDADTAILLYEIKKCNQLFLENLRLKAQITKTSCDNVNSKY